MTYYKDKIVTEDDHIDERSEKQLDTMLQDLLNNQFRSRSPRSVFNEVNQYVPTRVRASNVKPT